MSGLSQIRDSGAFYRGIGAGQVAITAAGAGDNTEFSSSYIDRTGFQSAKIVISGVTTLAAAETIAIVGANMQDADDISGTGVADFGTAYAPAAEVLMGGDSTGAQTDGDVYVEFNVDLVGARNFIRFQFTPNMSASATDTADLQVTICLGGAEQVGASLSLANLGPIAA